VAVLIEPLQELTNTSRRECYAGVRCAVVEIDRVTVGVDGVAAGEDDVGHVSLALVGCLGAENPRIAPKEAVVGLVEREKGDAETVERPRRRVPNAVIKHQPPSMGLNQRRREPDFVRVPPRAPACL